MPRLANRLMIAAMALTLAACKIVPTTEVEAARQVGASGAGPVFDPDEAVDAIWAAKVLPYLRAKAGDFVIVRDLAARNADDAGQKYGYRAKEGTVPWTYVVKAEGRIVAANTGSRAATIDVDVDGDGKADMVVQIGPAVRGTALRDSLDFVSFNAFTNQIEYAQFGKAFNARVNTDVLQALPREKLVGRSVTVLGAYVFEPGGKPPLVTPAELSLGAGS